MLQALLVVTAVASSARADDATRLLADADTRAEHIVQLCAEEHRESVAAQWGKDAYHIRHLPSLRGLVVEATQAEVAALKAHNGVCGVARSHQVIHRPDAGRRLDDVDALRRNNEWWGKSHNQGKPWNLDRVNGKLDGNDAFEVSSKGPNVFVLDTGLDTLHQEFDGDREVENVGSYSNFHPGGVWEDKKEWGLTSENRAWLKDNNDSDGHGTHCASTAAGKNYGIAPLANVYGMKVLPGGSEGVIVRALDRVYDLVKRKKVKGPTVVSMSLGGKCRDADGNEGPGTKYCAFETHYARAIRDLRDIGVLTAIAAGNNGEDACEMAPGASRDAVTVGATNINDRITFFSDYGNCVDIMAPGENVAGAASSREYGDERFLDDDVKEYSVLLGTSQATPLVAGSLLLYMQVLKNAEDALHALLNNAETIDARSKSSCPSNDLLLRAPGTTNKKDLDTSDGEHPCRISGDNEDWGGGDRPEGSDDDDDDDDGDANDEDEDQDSCADVGEQCREEGDCCEAPPRACFLKKGSSKGKCFDECPDDKAYECYEEEKCKGTGGSCTDSDECCSGRECFPTKDGKGTCEKECPDDDKYECYEAPCKGTGGKCSEDDDCCSGRTCFTIKGKDGTCEKECPDDKDYDCYCTDEGDRCSKDGDCCDSNKCFERKDGKGTCESKCPDDKDYECYEEPCKGTGGGCSKDSDCCDGRDCFEMKNGKATCERECPNDSDYKCWVRPTRKPTLEPTKRPTQRPTKRPTQRPTLATPRPSKQPTREPTREPTRKPTAEPSREPTRRPTDKPTARPVPRPTSPPESPCRNGIRDGSETDVDCGGTLCGPCEEGDKCRRDDDCEEPTDCINDRCRFRPSPRPTKEPTKNPTREPTREPSREPTRPPTERPTARPIPRPTSPPESPCRNGRRDGDETDVDCGGRDCGPCDRGERCKVSDDCEDPLACIDDRCTFPPTPKPSREPTDRPVAPPPDDDDDDDAVQPSARPSERPTRLEPTPRPSYEEPDACPRMGDLVDADSCPADPSTLPRCGVWKSGDMCLGDGTCGTSADEGNCFTRRRRLQAAGDPFAVYHVITNSKKKKTSGSFPWWAIVLMCLMLVGCCCCGLLIGVYWYRAKSQKADQKKRHSRRIAWDERERRSKARRASSRDAPPPYEAEEVKDEVDLDRAVPLAKVERLWTGDEADLDSVVVPAPSAKRIERVWTGGDADLDSVVIPAPRSAKRIERLWTGDDASLASIEAPPTAKNAPPRRASAKAPPRRAPRIERTWTGGDAPDSPRENPWRGARAAAGPAYGAYQVSGFPSPERQWTGAAASDSSGSLEAPAATRTPGQKYRQAVTGSAAAYQPEPTPPVAYRSPASTPSSAGSKSATYWRERAAATRGRAAPPSHLDLEPVARPRPTPTRPMPPRSRSPPRRTAVLGASAPPRRGRPTLLGVEDSTFISGAEDF